MSMNLCLNHIALPARDPEAQKQWYIKHLGFHENGNHLFSGQSVLSILSGTPLPNEDWHFGFMLSSPEELLQWRDKFEKSSIQPSELKKFGTYQSFYIRDPEGNDIEFFFDVLPSG